MWLHTLSVNSQHSHKICPTPYRHHSFLQTNILCLWAWNKPDRVFLATPLGRIRGRFLYSAVSLSPCTSRLFVCLFVCFSVRMERRPCIRTPTLMWRSREMVAKWRWNGLKRRWFVMTCPADICMWPQWLCGIRDGSIRTEDINMLICFFLQDDKLKALVQKLGPNDWKCIASSIPVSLVHFIISKRLWQCYVKSNLIQATLILFCLDPHRAPVSAPLV